MSNSNIHVIFEELKTDLNSQIDDSFKRANPEIKKYKKYKEAYDLIMNSSIVEELKRQNQKLIKENKKLTKLILRLSNRIIPVGPVVPKTTDDVVFIKVEKETTDKPNIVYELVDDDDVEVEEEEVEEVEEMEEVEEEVEEVEEMEEVEEEVEDVEDVEEVEEEEVEEEEVEVEEVEVEEVEVEEVEVEEVEVEEVEEEVEVEEEEVEEVEEEEEVEEVEDEVFEYTIGKKKYYITSETNGIIYNIDNSDEIGDEIGKMVNGKAKFNKS